MKNKSLRISILILVPVIAFLLSAFFFYAYTRYEASGDQNTYVFMARLFAKGRISAEKIEGWEGFTGMWQVHKGNRLYGKYPPLWPMLLSLGFLIGAEWLVNPLVGALCILLILLIGRELNRFTAGLLAALLLMFSPFWFVNQVKYFSHNLSTLLLTASLFFVLKYMKKGGGLFPFLTGLSLGGAFAARFVEAAAFVPIVGLFLILYAPEKSLKTTLRTGLLAAAGFLAASWPAFLYNLALSGNPFVTGYQVFNDEHLRFSLANTLFSLRWYVIYFRYFAKMFAGVSLILLIPFALARMEGLRKRFMIGLLSVTGALLVVYLGFPNHQMGVLGGGDLGPRYFQFLLIPFALGIIFSLKELSPKPALFPAVAVLLVLVQFFGFYIPHWKRYRQGGLANRNPVDKILKQAQPNSVVFTNIGTDYLVHLLPDIRKRPVVYVKDSVDRLKIRKSFPGRRYFTVSPGHNLQEIDIPAEERTAAFNFDEAHRYLLDNHASSFSRRDVLILAWECRKVDGIERLLVRGQEVRMEHLKFNPPEEIALRFYASPADHAGRNLRLIKDLGRGKVEITELPDGTNNNTLSVLVDDGAYESFGRYRFFIIAKVK